MAASTPYLDVLRINLKGSCIKIDVVFKANSAVVVCFEYRNEPFKLACKSSIVQLKRKERFVTCARQVCLLVRQESTGVAEIEATTFINLSSIL